MNQLSVKFYWRVTDIMIRAPEIIFQKSGWEGDGEINCIALSPCFSGRDDGWCDIIYHVKQSNNGTSWPAIPKSLKLQLPDGFLTKQPNQKHQNIGAFFFPQGEPGENEKTPIL